MAASSKVVTVGRWVTSEDVTSSTLEAGVFTSSCVKAEEKGWSWKVTTGDVTVASGTRRNLASAREACSTAIVSDMFAVPGVLAAMGKVKRDATA